ncbi:Pre-mRNA-splicing factor 18, partial [Durusdinium trenchii]
MQIAGQTRRNLQYVALTTALLTIGKPREWDAWRQSHGLNEIHIERHFGQLRGQASNSELTARDYWYAVADNSRKMAKKHESPKNHVKPTVEEPLLEPEIRSCAKRALAASLLLVSRCSDIDVQSLEKLYRTECIGDFFDEPDMVGEDLLELSLLAKEMQDVTEADHNQLKNQIDQHERDQQGDAAEDQTEMPTAQDPDAALPDGQQLVDLTSNLPPRSDESQNYPKTLAEALALDNWWSGIWQLALHLRCGPSGMDNLYLRGGEEVRYRARKLNWHQNLEHQLKEIRMNQDEMMAGQRGSRISKWIQHSSTMRDRAGWQEDLDEECYWEPSPNTWMYGQEHLLAILDVDTQRTAVNRGHFFLTPASEEMILKVQSEEHPAAPHRGLNVKKRRKPPKLKLGAALKKAASAKIAKKAQEAPTPSSIRRSVALHVKVRNAERYGLLVYKTITDLTQQMEQNPAKRSLLLNIIQDAIKAKYKRMRQLEKEDHEGKKNPDLVMLEAVHANSRTMLEDQKGDDEDDEDEDGEKKDKEKKDEEEDEKSEESESEEEKMEKADGKDSEKDSEKESGEDSAVTGDEKEKKKEGEEAPKEKPKEDQVDMPEVDLGTMDRCDMIRAWVRKSLKAWEK